LPEALASRLPTAVALANLGGTCSPRLFLLVLWLFDGRFLSLLCAHASVCPRHIRHMRYVRRRSSIFFLLCARVRRRVRRRVGTADTGGELSRVMHV